MLLCRTLHPSFYSLFDTLFIWIGIFGSITMNSIYEAVPLDRDISSTNIRVIENLVRDEEGRISCKLRTISLGWKDDERRSQRPESYLGLMLYALTSRKWRNEIIKSQ